MVYLNWQNKTGVKMLNTLTVRKEKEVVKVTANPSLSGNRAFTYTLIDSVHTNRVHYTNDSSKLVRILERLYNKGFKDE